jgi:hypothetical protein
MDMPSARIKFGDDFARINQIQQRISVLQREINELKKEEYKIWKRNDFKFEMTNSPTNFK